MVMAITTAKSRVTWTPPRTSMIAMSMNIATVKNQVAHILPTSLLAMAMHIATAKNPTVLLLMSMLAMITSTVKSQSACFVPLSMLAMTMSMSMTRTTSIIVVMNRKRCTQQMSTPALTISMTTIQSRSTQYRSRLHRLVTMSRKANADATANTKMKGVDITQKQMITFQL